MVILKNTGYTTSNKNSREIAFQTTLTILLVIKMQFSYRGIARITLPDDWQQLDPSMENAVRFRCPVKSDDSAVVGMTFYYREESISNGSFQKFKELLQRPVHSLSPAEFIETAEIIRDASDNNYFEMTQAYTKMLKGRMIYVVQGHWTVADTNSLAFFVPEDGEATRRLLELYFIAPPDLFEVHLANATEIFSTIEWA